MLIIRYGKIWNLFLKNGIYNENNGINIDWNKIELIQNFIKGIIKLIDEVNEYKFLSDDLQKNMNKYYEDKRIKNIIEKQKLKNVYNNDYSVERIQELLNSRNKNDLNLNMNRMSNHIKILSAKQRKKDEKDSFAACGRCAAAGGYAGSAGGGRQSRHGPVHGPEPDQQHLRLPRGKRFVLPGAGRGRHRADGKGYRLPLHEHQQQLRLL